ncbi:MAG: ABC transporter permease subunit [Firmicutes bacterium]|nr:ABC transporter permease subunit [Bacillota bacterium]
MNKKKSLLSKIAEQHRLYIMMLPMLIAVTLFAYLPLSGWVMAFTDYQIGGSLFGGEFIGFRQFEYFFTQAVDSGYVLRNTLVINLLTLVINLFSACAFAILLNEVRTSWTRRIVQSFSFFPFFVSWVITYSIFNSFLAMQTGVINILLKNLGVIDIGINFLGDPKYSWGVMLFVNFWKYIGYNSVIFLSAISGIDQEQYEAASIDGATHMQKIRLITLPALAPTLAILLIMNSGWIFSSNFEEFNLFYNSVNWERMEVLDIYVYRYGLKLHDYSYATAVGIIKTVASLILLFVVNTAAKRFNGRSLL